MEHIMGDPPLLPPFSVCIAGNEHAVRDGLAQVMLCLMPLALSADDTSTTELVLAETLNNVIEHALSDSKVPTTIEIRGAFDVTNGLRMTVIDRGAPMPTGKAPVGKAPDLDVSTDDLPEGGFGGFMIHTLASDVRYTRVGEANHLILQLPVGI